VAPDKFKPQPLISARSAESAEWTAKTLTGDWAWFARSYGPCAYTRYDVDTGIPAIRTSSYASCPFRNTGIYALASYRPPFQAELQGLIVPLLRNATSSVATGPL
jgi:hypothetical protein